MSWSLGKYGFYAGIFSIFCFLLMTYAPPLTQLQETASPETTLPQTSTIRDDENFLVDTQNCKIPNLNPWNFETKPLYFRKSYVKCSNTKKLTQIDYVNGDPFLQIDESVVSQYNTKWISCCYSNISRGTGDSPDLGISVSSCVTFENKVKLHEDSIFVKCKNVPKDEEIYSNTHSLLPKTIDVQRKINMFKGKPKPPSLILIGIDSMSRLNFHRTFRRTKHYLENNSWLEYKGYNKIGDNTLPNLMALLTGKNLSAVLNECDPRERVDRCNFIWNDYNKLGYITAYGEDETGISTFTTYSYQGFREKPTDFYYMPYMSASEKLLDVRRLDGMTYCTGPETSAERILNIVDDMTSIYPKHPKFGFFWMNSFSHEDINAPARVDEIFHDFFSRLQSRINENTVVLFFSDHGIRFGDIRVTRSGWLEERLPFLYFWIPSTIKKKFPEETRYLTVNSNKLTTPYDVYMTLQHVLVLSKLNYDMKPSEACPDCKSLFSHIDNRSCEDAKIQFHWCTCFGYARLDPKSELALAASKFAIYEINTKLDKDLYMYNKCARFKLNKVISAGISDSNSYNKTFLLLIFETRPKAKYEVTVSVYFGDSGRYFINEGSTSRLDRYDSTSSCVTENKMYCYCDWNLQWQMSLYSLWFEI